MKTISFSILVFFIVSCGNIEPQNKRTENNTDPVGAVAGTTPIAGINCFDDYDTGLAYAKQVGKPILLHFTGWVVVNSREMEDRVWVDPEIHPALKNEYVVICLYVDDKASLPEDKQYKSSSGKDITHTGQKWMDMEETRFKSATQPLYVILDTNEKQLLGPIGYTPEVHLFSDFLEEGVAEFEKRNK
jgi:thiol:disulfide interchange protein DsbD